MWYTSLDQFAYIYSVFTVSFNYLLTVTNFIIVIVVYFTKSHNIYPTKKNQLFLLQQIHIWNFNLYQLGYISSPYHSLKFLFATIHLYGLLCFSCFALCWQIFFGCSLKMQQWNKMAAFSEHLITKQFQTWLPFSRTQAESQKQPQQCNVSILVFYPYP